MFYKVMNNQIVIDLLQEVCYIRYLPKSKRWVGTDKQSAHGILGSDQNTIYHLEGTACPYEAELLEVSIIEITENEYNYFANEIALRAKEKEELINKINTLEEIVNKQNSLLEALLIRLES